MMPPAADAGILPRLRAETRPYHDALEATPFNAALSAGTLTAADTRQFLAKMYGFMQPCEAQLRAHEALFGPEWELPARYRAHLILSDLGLDPAAPGLPLCPALPPLDSWPRLLGALYVLEGSTLGGQVIARQLGKAGIGASRYFAGAGALTGPRWKSFCQLLTAAAPATDEAELVASASRTFQSLHAWLLSS